MGLDIKSLFTGGISGVLDSAKGIIGQFVADPAQKAEAIQKLADEANRHEEALLVQVNDMEKSYLKDTEDARNREIAIATSDKAPLINKIVLPCLAGLVTFGFFGILAFMMWYSVPTSNERILDIMLGSLGTAWIGIISYYFGSSAGSKDKAETIKKMMDK